MDLLKYKGKVAVISGAATGMGKATTELLLKLGAEVHAMDIAPIESAVAQALKVDLSDEQSIHQAVQKLPAKIDLVFSCAGISSIYLGKRFSPTHVNLVNFVGPRLLVEMLVPRIRRGAPLQ